MAQTESSNVINQRNTLAALDFIEKQVAKNKRKIALLTMAYAPNSKTLLYYYEMITNIDKIGDKSTGEYNELTEVKTYNYVASYSAALYILLFIKTGYIPLDCHLNNILVIDNSEQQICTLIDFGKTIQFFSDNEETKNSHNFTRYKETFNLVSNYDKDFETIKGIMSYDLKEIISNPSFLKQIVLFMMGVDFSYNDVNTARSYPQAMRILTFLTSKSINEANKQNIYKYKAPQEPEVRDKTNLSPEELQYEEMLKQLEPQFQQERENEKQKEEEKKNSEYYLVLSGLNKHHDRVFDKNLELVSKILMDITKESETETDFSIDNVMLLVKKKLIFKVDTNSINYRYNP